MNEDQRGFANPCILLLFPFYTTLRLFQNGIIIVFYRGNCPLTQIYYSVFFPLAALLRRRLSLTVSVWGCYSVQTFHSFSVECDPLFVATVSGE